MKMDLNNIILGLSGNSSDEELQASNNNRNYSNNVINLALEGERGEGGDENGSKSSNNKNFYEDYFDNDFDTFDFQNI